MKRPHDDKGKYVSLACPMLNCGGGTLRFEGDGLWRCDGLAEPDRADQDLYACPFTHRDGEAYEVPMDDAERYAVMGAM
jgi:hypothetical protein